MVFRLIDLAIHLGQQPLFEPVNLTLHAGQIGTIMGPSGSGKSTLLAAISGTLPAGFELSGDIVLNQRSLIGLPIQQRQVGILFQEDLLFPHLNVGQNLLFGVPPQANPAQRRQRVADALASADLAGFEPRDITTLSGGQRARISLLRTLLSEPDLVVLDEPFSKLDLALRGQFREWVFTRIQQLGIPALLVTHDPNDCPDPKRRLDLLPPNTDTPDWS
ncbi:MAG: ATP-binding cassette domain-containing protein [Saccharospirillum sp.]